MTEDERMFKKLLQKDKNLGTKNRVIRKGNIYKFPGWVFDESGEEFVIVKYKTVKRRAEEIDCTVQILYDILILGLTDISQRPKCKVCGKVLSMRRFSEGYPVTCGSTNCKKDYARKEMLNMWKDQSYRNTQSKSHKVWAEKPENKEYLRKRAIDSWKIPEYREHQSQVHKEFAKNNPNKIRNGIHGTINITKSIKGTFRYDSSWERDLVLLMDKIPEVISIERPDFYIPYKYNGESFSYFPDISVKFSNNNLYLIEVKAKWLIKFDPRVEWKIKAGEDYVKNSNYYYKYILLTEDQLCDSRRNILVEDIAKEELLKLI